MAKPRASKVSKKKKVAEESPKETASAKPLSVAPKARSVPPKAVDEPLEPRGKKKSLRPPPPPDDEDEAREAAESSSAPPRWEERGDKDAYAFDLLERLVRYYGGRASATSSEAMRSVAFVLSTLSLSLASSDDEQLAALARAARDVRRGGAST